MQINLHPGEVTQTMDFGQNYLNVHQDNPRAALAPCSKSDVSCDKHLSILYPQLCQKSIVGANPPQNSPTTATRQGPLRHVVTKWYSHLWHSKTGMKLQSIKKGKRMSLQQTSGVLSPHKNTRSWTNKHIKKCSLFYHKSDPWAWIGEMRRTTGEAIRHQLHNHIQPKFKCSTCMGCNNLRTAKKHINKKHRSHSELKVEITKNVIVLL